MPSLSPQSAEIVRATLPAVGGAIADITPRFYDRMFSAHPELRDRLFNRGNQRSGAQQQALAGAVAAFASMLVAEPAGGSDVMLRRISHKHASLGVTADQYEIVRVHLFAAIVDVLGDAVTPEVGAAWGEVYQLMADTLIGIEQGLYDEAGLARAGESWRTWRVVARTDETADVASFELVPADGGGVALFKPGQYLSVAVELPDGARQIRQYSLCSAPGAATLRIAVKRVDGEVSDWLHANVRTGSELTAGEPFGDLVLDASDAPLLLASAGIGITPMVAMLEHLVATGSKRRVVVVHADRSQDTHALRGDVEKLVAELPDAQLHVWYETADEDHPADRIGYADLAKIDVAAGTRAYLCGPLPFMRAARTALLEAGVPAADVHYEVFGPDLWHA